MKVYLAGPMRGLPEYNFPAFHAAATDLRAKGHNVWSPAERDLADGFDPATDEAAPLRHYMAQDLPQVLAADMVVALPGWETSTGAKLEVNTALVCDIPAVSYPDFRPLALSHPAPRPQGRVFASGATRDTDDNKLDYEGFFSPAVLRARAEYMHEHRRLPDGSLRASDNWQRGIPHGAYMSSAFRHFVEWWTAHRRGDTGPEIQRAIAAVMFNAEGYLAELLKENIQPEEGTA